MAWTQPLISVPRPASDQVLMVVCARDGAMASIVINEVLVRDSNLEQFLVIMRETQERIRRERAHAHTEDR